MTSDSRRLAILTTREINELYGLPCFTDEERCIYFDLSPAEHDAVDAVYTDAAAVESGTFRDYTGVKSRS